MPSCSEPDLLRAILDSDRPWALYLLGDLDPQRWPHCQWWCADGAVALLYRRFERPVLAAFGEAAAVRPLLDEMPREPMLYLHVRSEVSTLVEERYRVPAVTRMIRMALDPAHYRAAPTAGAFRLAAGDADAVGALYRDGEAADEVPGFYVPEMIDEGVYFGVRDGGELIAVAGTHLISARESVAAVGNVYTRRDHRGRGLAATTTSAVVTELLAAGVRTVALSVDERNATAIRVYQSLGFHPHCGFIEGEAHLR